MRCDPGMTTTAFPSPATIRLRSTRDVLAAIPYLLGYRPAECAVVVGVSGQGRLGPVAHVTLADLPVVGLEGVRLVARRAADAGARRAVVGVYTGACDGAADAAVEPLLTALEEAVGDVETWVVTPDGYRRLDCADPACCPPGGHPRAELDSAAVSAAFVLSGRSVAPTASAAFAVPRAPSPARDLAGRAARRWQRAGEAARADGAARRAWERDGCSAWRDAVRHATTELELSVADDGPTPPAPVPVPPATLGRLAAALADTSVRDAILLSLVADACGPQGTHGPGTTEEPPDIEYEAAEACARLIDPASAVVPDGLTTSAARAVLEAVVAHVPRRLQAAPLTLLGLIAWWRGEGGLAGARVREALTTDDEYRLAVIVGDILTAAVPPGWVRRSSTEGVG
jgi:hypothetical protein